MHATLDKFGRIVIPKPIRDRLGLEAGDELRVDVDDQDDSAITLRPKDQESPLVRKGPVLVFRGKAVEGRPLDAAAVVRADREQRIRGLAGGKKS